MKRKRGVVAGGALAELGIRTLAPAEQRVLAALAESAAAGRCKKAGELAEATDLSLEELERVCDGLLEKGLIGPGPARATRRPS